MIQVWSLLNITYLKFFNTINWSKSLKTSWERRKGSLNYLSCFWYEIDPCTYCLVFVFHCLRHVPLSLFLIYEIHSLSHLWIDITWTFAISLCTKFTLNSLYYLVRVWEEFNNMDEVLSLRVWHKKWNSQKLLVTPSIVPLDMSHKQTCHKYF